MKAVQRPYGLRERSTYEEVMQYIKRDNGEFLVPKPDRESTIVEMMSPYLSAWKVEQQAMLAKKQAQIAFWSSDGDPGAAPLPLQAGDDDFKSVPGTIDSMVNGAREAWDNEQRNMYERGAQEVHREAQRHVDRQTEMYQIGTDSGDADMELAQHLSHDLQPVTPPATEEPQSAESLRDAFLHRGRQGALANTLAAGGTMASGALAGLWGGASLAEAVGATVGVAAGTAALPVAAAVGGTLLGAAAIGGLIGGGAGVAQNLEERAGTRIHFVSDSLQNLADRSGTLWANRHGMDPHRIEDVHGRQALGPDRMARPVPELGYDHARHQAVTPMASQALRGAGVGTMPSTIPSAPPRTRRRGGLEQHPIPNFPGGERGHVEYPAIHPRASGPSGGRPPRPGHGNGLGR